MFSLVIATSDLNLQICMVDMNGLCKPAMQFPLPHRRGEGGGGGGGRVGGWKSGKCKLQFKKAITQNLLLSQYNNFLPGKVHYVYQ